MPYMLTDVDFLEIESISRSLLSHRDTSVQSKANDIKNAIHSAARVKWQPPSTAPKDGKPFRITTQTGQQDLAVWVEIDRCFKDYYHKQRVLFVAWMPLSPAAEIGTTDAETARLNGWH